MFRQAGAEGFSQLSSLGSQLKDKALGPVDTVGYHVRCFTAAGEEWVVKIAVGETFIRCCTPLSL